MSRRLAGLAAFMRELSLSLDGFSNRILTQKTIYLCQVVGVDLGYRYNWYLKGPYSPALTSDAFELKDITQFQNVRLKDHVRGKIQVVNDLLAKHHNYDLEKADWSELLVSLHYLRHISPQPVKKTKDEVINALCECKNYFTSDQAACAWDELNQMGLIENIEVSIN